MRRSLYFLSLGIVSLVPIGPAARRDRSARAASGYVAEKLPLPADILPSCMAVRPDGTLVVGSMDGDILLVTDSDGDGVLDRYTPLGGDTAALAARACGSEGEDVLMATRGALLRLSDRDRDGWAERWRTLSDAWDVSHDHHDWTTGSPPGRGRLGGLPGDRRRARRRASRATSLPAGQGRARRPRRRDERPGRRAPLPDRLGDPAAATARSFSPTTRGSKRRPARSTGSSPATGTAIPARPTRPRPGHVPYMPPSVRLPYPWARSVNGLEFADTGGGFGPLEGQLVLCEYNNRFILRASLEEVDGQEQGACYPFLDNLLGPLCLAFAPGGVLYVGSMREPAWGAEPEQGAIYPRHLLRPRPRSASRS